MRGGPWALSLGTRHRFLPIFYFIVGKLGRKKDRTVLGLIDGAHQFCARGNVERDVKKRRRIYTLLRIAVIETLGSSPRGHGSPPISQAQKWEVIEMLPFFTPQNPFIIILWNVGPTIRRHRLHP
jgi:hypothetical protein